MSPDRAPPLDPPAPFMPALALLFLVLWLPAGIAATIWWFK